MEILELIRKLNWVDLVIVVLIARSVYIGIKVGFGTEFFKALGVIFAISLAFLYYRNLSNFLELRNPLVLDRGRSEFISFVFLSSAMILAFKFIREGFFFLAKVEFKPTVDKWLGGLFGLGRGLLLASLLVFIMGMSGVSYCKGSLDSSLSAGKIEGVAPGVFQVLNQGIFSKFFPSSTSESSPSEEFI